MIINSSNVNMAARTTKKVSYTKTTQTLMTNAQTGEKQFSENTFQYTYANYNRLGSMQDSPKNRLRQDMYLSDVSEREKSSMQDLVNQLKNFLLKFRNDLTMMIGRRITGSIYNDYGTLNVSSGSGGVSVWRRTEYTSYTYEEEETLSFETTGQVITKDGRAIDFNMTLEMSREFQETVETLNMDTVKIMTDPLVISLNSNPVSVSDQKWKFDIDGDGIKDSISMLSEGSGFLAFDKNMDGIINDGSELFGAATGNGFAELAEYDEDGNGWIDENDSIYNKLSVWLKDDSGNDRMVSLKDVNVGAIYLASKATNFSLKSEEDNSHNAEIRQTGIYLTEDGVANTIQQLDMVKELLTKTA